MHDQWWQHLQDHATTVKRVFLNKKNVPRGLIKPSFKVVMALQRALLCELLCISEQLPNAITIHVHSRHYDLPLIHMLPSPFFSTATVKQWRAVVVPERLHVWIVHSDCVECSSTPARWERQTWLQLPIEGTISSKPTFIAMYGTGKAAISPHYHFALSAVFSYKHISNLIHVLSSFVPFCPKTFVNILMFISLLFLCI